MAFTARVFFYRGITQLPVNVPKQFASDAVYQLTQPYEDRGQLAINGATVATAVAPAAPAHVDVVRIEVPDGEAIRYEIRPPGSAVVADANSPKVSGNNNFQCSPGWTVSAIDAAGT